jgi:hypothetical protein
MNRCSTLLRSLFALLAALALQTTHAAITDGLLSYWPLDAVSADNTAVDVAFTNHFSVIGAPVVSSGQVSNAFTFDGATTYLINSHTTDNTATGLPIYNAGTYSISMWIKGPAATTHYILTEGNSGNNTPLFVFQTGAQAANNAKFDVIIRSDGNTTLLNHIQSTNVVFDNNWHHIVWVDDRGAAKLYVDGVQDPANFNYTRSGTFTFNNTVVGALVRTTVAATTQWFNGQIDDLAMWERALTASEVADLKANSLPKPLPPLGVVLTSQPASVTKNLGDWALFSVTQYGQRPISYQWFKNGNLITDATNRTYQVTGLTTANSGDFYAVKVTNPVNSATTTNATITVVGDPAADVRRDLVNYWPLNSIDQLGSDLVSTDLYSGNNMVLKGFVDTNDIVDGKFGKALAFDFVTKYTYRTNGTPIYSTTNYSVSMWVKAPFTSQNDRRVFSEGSSTSDNPLFTLGTDSAGTSASASVLVRGDNNVSVLTRKTTRPVFDDTWHHIVWTDTNGKGKLYVDGVLDESDFNYVRPVSTLNRTSLGVVLRAVVTTTTFYLGNIDEVATWKRPLTYTEVQSIMTNGIPAPIEIIAPSIVTQPLNHTNGVFVGDTVNFNVTATGTSPFTFAWYRNNTLIPAASNPSAATDTLSLTNVSGSDSNTTYFVKITNAKGTATSDTVTLNVTPFTPLTNGTVLQVDVDLTGSPNLQPGFDEFNLGINGTNYNGVGLTVSGIGTALAERLRAVPVNNPPALTQAQLYNDFIFANNITDGTGMRILIERLAPNTKYGLTIWSWDASSTTLRSSVWQETSNPEAPIDIANPYTFDGAVAPTADNQDSFTAILTSTAQGKLQIDGLRSGGNSFGVFLNALRLVANPSANISSVSLTGNTLDINVLLLSPDQIVSLQERASLTTGSWGPSTVPQVNQIGNTVTFETTINPTTPQMFYRVVSQ